jgi:heme-degrading monooxygenase HmoA
MYIAMNRFRIAMGMEADFEELWRTRDTQLTEVPGFQTFHLLRGEEEEGAAIYVSHTMWASRDAFEAWTQSEAFRSAHAKARAPEGTYLGPPKFEGFDVVL